MRAYLRSHCLSLAYLFFGTMLLGTSISGLLTTDTRWMSWHFSRLGEGGMLSALIFNSALLVSAVIMGALGLALTDNIAHLSAIEGVNLPRAKMIIGRSFNIITICLIGLATFPFDTFPVLHNIFGYSMFFTFLFLCVTTPSFLPIFSRKFYLYSQGAILLATLCYVLFLVVGSITLLTVESIMYTCLYGWLLLFVSGIQKTATTALNY